MIRINRRLTPPTNLKATSKSLLNAKAKIQGIIDAGEDPNSDDFTSLWGNKTNRDIMWRMQHGRCCYCERLRDTMRESDIEHFRPKSSVDEKNPKKPGYWWLAYEWNNLLFACRACNQEYKKIQFPIRGIRAAGPDDDLSTEDALIIDPCSEDPETFIDYDFTSSVVVTPNGKAPDREKGNKTIEVCKLDREDLGLQRRAVVKSSLKPIHERMIDALKAGSELAIARIGKEITEATSAESKLAFIGMRRAYFRARDLDEFVAKD